MNKLTQPVCVRRSDIDNDLAKFLDASEFRWWNSHKTFTQAEYWKEKGLDEKLVVIHFRENLNLGWDRIEIISESSITPIDEFKKLIGYTEPTKFSVEQCKADGWRCEYHEAGECKLVTEKPDKRGQYVIEHEDEYFSVSDTYLRNIEKEEWRNIYERGDGSVYLGLVKHATYDAAKKFAKSQNDHDKHIATIPMHKLKNIDWSKV